MRLPFRLPHGNAKRCREFLPAPGAPPIDGDPKELLNDWMKRLELKFDEW